VEIVTKFHGVKKFAEEEIIKFPKGIPGFESFEKFILFPLEENDVFSVLHSIEDESIGLVVASPFDLKKDYEIKLEDSLLERLNIKEEAEVILLNVVTVNSKVEDITVNLKAPIVINIKAGLGEQIILDRDDYKIKHPLLQG
jgi:flagellar assembly factor FliW